MLDFERRSALGMFSGGTGEDWRPAVEMRCHSMAVSSNGCNAISRTPLPITSNLSIVPTIAATPSSTVLDHVVREVVMEDDAWRGTS